MMIDTAHSFRQSLRLTVLRDKVGNTLIFFMKYYHPKLLFGSIEEIKEGKINNIKYQENKSKKLNDKTF